jgi:hypoxanthine phosphoribosyltransferase
MVTQKLKNIYENYFLGGYISNLIDNPDKSYISIAMKSFNSEKSETIFIMVYRKAGYGDNKYINPMVKIVKDLDDSIAGKDVLVVEDIIDSGRTLSYLLELLKDRKPNSLKLCTLLDKPDRRVVDVNIDYTAFEVPDQFVVGYGLDYDQKYRNLPYIGVVEFE